jgi:hypothetical protein
MAWQTASYATVRERMQPGDIIAFSSNQGFSRLIKMATRSQVTHVGIVFQSKLYLYGEAQPGFFNQVMESMSVNPTTAATIVNRLSDRVKFYDGEIWWLPLRRSVRDQMDLQEFYNFLLHQEHKTFDVVQAVKAAFDIPARFPLTARLAKNVEDYSKLFCSELASAALEHSGAIGSINASEVTPIDLCMFSIYEPNYYQIKGKPKAISGYNSLDPAGWGQ